MAHDEGRASRRVSEAGAPGRRERDGRGQAAPGEPGRRDRDGRGRARNARPRDAAGRPLARGADGVEALPDDLALPPTAALAEAQRLLDAGRPFQAHEVLEGTWKATDGDERPLWQGLAQLAVGLTHAQRGNATGARALLERGAEHLTPFTAHPPHGLDVDGLRAHATALIARIDAEGLGALEPADVRPRLRGPTSWSDVVAMATELPEVEESTSYRTPALKVAGRSFARLRTEAEGGLMLLCAPEEKEALLAAGDPTFYTTAHYDGYASILVDLATVDPTQLRELLEEAWRRKAPARLLRARP